VLRVGAAIIGALFLVTLPFHVRAWWDAVASGAVVVIFFYVAIRG
jgi:hypothetical protein